MLFGPQISLEKNEVLFQQVTISSGSAPNIAIGGTQLKNISNLK